MFHFVVLLFIFLSIKDSFQDSLRFTADGKFKIMQVADLHFQKGDQKCRDIDVKQYPHCYESNSTIFIENAVKAENPDLVIYTGDQIDFATLDAKSGLQSTFSPCEKTATSWAATLGNHDGENLSKMSRKEVVEYMTSSTFKYSLTQLGSDEIHGYSNFFLDILSNNGTESKFRLFLFDSGDGSVMSEKVKGYDWIFQNQLEWYVKNGLDGIPEFSFFHIPLLEFKDLIDKKFPIVGKNWDVFHIPEVNSGAFTTFLENGRMKGIFVGHDHLNDYCGKYYGDIAMCYGGVVGMDAYSKAGLPRRVRIIELEDFGKSCKTWKRLFDSDMSSVDLETLF